MRFLTSCSGLVLGESLQEVSEYLQSQAFLQPNGDRPAKNVIYLKPEHVPARLSFWKLMGVLPYIDGPNHSDEARVRPYVFVGELGVNAIDRQAAISYLTDCAWLQPSERMSCLGWTSPKVG